MLTHCMLKIVSCHDLLFSNPYLQSSLFFSSAPSSLGNSVVEEVIHPCNPNPCPSNHLCQVNRKGCLDELNCQPYLCLPGWTELLYMFLPCLHLRKKKLLWVTTGYRKLQAVNWARRPSSWCSRTLLSRCRLAWGLPGATKCAAAAPVGVWRTAWRCRVWTSTSPAS